MKSIFVSSTFRDMQAERDALVLNVVPEIDTYAASFGQNIRFVDLRWGVNTTDMSAEKSSRKVLKVCLDEIDKTRPYMIILIGERYGWVPEDKELMRRVAKEKGHMLESVEKSVTELEIEYGALGNKGNLKNCLFYFREPLPKNKIPPEIKAVYIEKNIELENKLQHLKRRIESAGGKTKHYTVQWNDKKKSINIPQDFCDMVVNDIKELFAADFEETKNLKPIEREQVFAMLFAQQKALQFAARFDLLEKYASIILSQDKNLLFLRGEPGSGKSTIMSKLALDLVKNANVFFFSCGNTSLSQTSFDIVRGAVHFVESLLNLTTHYGEGENEPKHTFAEWASLLENLCDQYGKKNKKPLMFFIDALDQLAQDEDTRGLKFLPHNLPYNVTFVVSALSDYETREMHPLHDKCAKEEILPLHDEERKKVVHGILKTYSKQLNSGVVNALIAAKGATNPLYISMMIQRLIMLDSEDFGVIEQFGNDMDAINKFLTDTVNSTPNNVEEMSAEVLREASQRINEDLCLHAAALIATSRRGLREKDLAEIFKLNNKNWISVDFASYIKYLKPFFIQRHDGRIDFTHRTIRLGFLKQIDFKKYNAQILELLKQIHIYDGLRLSETIYHSLMQEDYNFTMDHILEIDFASKTINSAEKAITADEMYAMAVTQARYVNGLLLAYNKRTSMEEEYHRNCKLLNFFINDFYNTLGGSDLERNIAVMFLERIVISAQELAQKVSNNEDLEINLCKCYAVLAIAHDGNNVYDDLTGDDCYETHYAYKEKCKNSALELVKKYNSMKSKLNYYYVYYMDNVDFESYANELGMNSEQFEICAIETYENLINSGDYSVLEMYINYCVRFSDYYIENYDSAVTIAEKAYALTKNLYKTKNIGVAQFAAASLNLADTYFRANILKKAPSFFLEALDICEELIRQGSFVKNYLLYAKTHRYYGLYQKQAGLYKQAIENFTSSIEKCENFIASIGSYECYISLARSYEYRADCNELMGDREKAIKDYRECYKLADIITRNFPVNEYITEEQRIYDIFYEKYGVSEMDFVSVISEEKLEKELIATKTHEYMANNFDGEALQHRLIGKYKDLAEQLSRFKKYEQLLKIQHKIVDLYKKLGKNLPKGFSEANTYGAIATLNDISSTLHMLKRNKDRIEINKQIIVELANKIDNGDFYFNKFLAVGAITTVANFYNEIDDFENAEKFYKEGIRLFDKVIDNYEHFLMNSNEEMRSLMGTKQDATAQEIKSETEYETKNIEEMKTDLYKQMVEMYIKKGKLDSALKCNKMKIEFLHKHYTFEDKETGAIHCKMYCYKNFEIVNLYKQRADIFKQLNDKQSAADALCDALYFHMVDDKYIEGARKNEDRAKEYSELSDEYTELLTELNLHEHAKMYKKMKENVLASLEKAQAEKLPKEEKKETSIIKKYKDKDGNETGAYMRIYTDEYGKEQVDIIDY